jgi:hypothetical protein
VLVSPLEAPSNFQIENHLLHDPPVAAAAVVNERKKGRKTGKEGKVSRHGKESTHFVYVPI